MVVDIDKYKANKEFVQRWLTKHQDKPIGPSIASMAVATMVPCIVVAYWAGEVTNWSQEVIYTIQRLKEFYGYHEVRNRPANAPI